MSETKPPYNRLGKRLKTLREKRQESLAEVSGAVEIEEFVLQHIEAGRLRPAEEILVLLMNHFDMPEPEADKLWELAGYEPTEEPSAANPLPEIKQAMMVLLGLDGRTLSTDSAEIISNDSGIVLQFAQHSAQGQHVPIARVGMSHEQAAKLAQILQKTLLYNTYQRPKGLPPAGANQSENDL